IFMLTGTFEAGAVYLWDEPLLYKMPLAFVALLLILPIKLKKSPFDVAEAHQEVTGGVEMEFSGLFYEAVYTAKWLDYVFCYTLVFLFAGNNILLGIGLVVFTFFYLNALDNSSARVNYKQMLRFSLGVAFSLAFINLLINILS
ncbi:MAG TPA: NADH-quinone oxidoreductase subunit H, partial [Chitinophagaceae bacterium]|nr:NADH-quinone oxidoreductase subunit H [Chitinophagaceae bacterium]